MLQRRQLAGEAVYQALSFRKRLGTALDEAVSPIDGAETLGVEVRMIDLPSMEGIYMAGSQPTIVLSSLRPQGRRHFTCAHELGHHAFGHGQQFDEIANERGARRSVDPREFSADCFAAYFLMPKLAVDSGMSRRGFSYEGITAADAYAMSSWLGVGYETFVNHLQYGLRMVSSTQGDDLRKWKPQAIRTALLGFPLTSHLHLVDHAWVGRAVDCEVGDYLVVPDSTLCEGDALCLIRKTDKGLLLRVEAAGIARVSGTHPFWGAFVRASRSKFSGRARFRFDEESVE